MATNDLKLKVTLSADGKQLSGTLKTAQGEVHAFGVKAEKAGDAATNSFSKTRKGVESISTQLQRAQSAALAFIGVSQGLSGISSVIQIADDYGEMAKRVEMATTTAVDYDLVQKRLLTTAGGTYRALSEAQELYIQTADALRSLGYNTEQQLDITDSLSYAFVVNSTSAEKAGSAINAFSRSIQTGKVAALDWQSLLMATPTLVNDIASATGKTTSEIRSLGIQGKLSLDELTEGLRLSRDENQRLADGMDTTVADAFVRLRTNFSAFIGEANKSHQVTQKLSAAIVLVAENLDVVGDAALVVATAVGGRLLGAAASNAIAFSAARVEAVRYQAALASMTGVSRTTAVGLGALTTSATAARSALALLGGPAGLAITAGVLAIGYVFNQSAKAAAELDAQMLSAEKTYSDYKSRQTETVIADRIAAELAEIERLQSFIRDAHVSIAQFNALISEKPDAGISASIDSISASVEAAESTIERHRAGIELLRAEIAELGGAYDAGVLQTAAQKEAVEKLVDGLNDQYVKLALNEEAYLRYQLAAAGATAEQIQHAIVVQRGSVALKEQQKAQEEAAAAAKKLTEEHEDWVKAVVGSVDPARELQAEIDKLQEAWDGGIFKDSNLDESAFYKYIDNLKKKMAELNGVKIQDPAVKLGNAMQTTAGGLRDVAGAMQGMHEQGTRGYQEMAVAMQATNVLAAIGAVLEQGKGDPYSAFARMAAMAAAVTALGVQVSMMGSDFPDDAARQQAAQGTGTVLGDSAAKSESIAHAVDITAAATSQLVGINRDMLRALVAMQAGITGATVRIAQGAKNVDFGATYKPSNVFDLTSNFGQDVYSIPGLKQIDQLNLGVISGAFKAVGKFLGGSSKITDQGIQIIGGSLGELMEDVVVGAYQVTKSKKYKWSSSKTRINYETLGDDVSDQFSLVFESLADSVYAGAVALGFSSAEVERQINEYNIATQTISTMGLTAEQQQKEIEAVFSSIFDGLAGSVVTFLPEFQQAGEGLGETLARVATNVQVTEEAVNRLGFQAQRLGAEQFAELSVSLIEAAGGLEQFINGMGAFVDKFASDKKKFELASSDMERALKAVGLAVPASREGMWDLMQTLDASTAQGREQIAALLELTATSDAYYKMLEEAQGVLEGLLGAEISAELTSYFEELSNYIRAESQAIEQDYKERINLLERQSSLSKQLGDYVAKLRLSDLSPAAPAEKLAQAGDEFAALLVRAQAGDLEAAAKLQGAADTYLKNADSYYGRSDAYTGIFDDVAKQLEDLGLALGATSTEEHIKSLNEQMLAEQQQQRDLLQAELDWAVAQYSKLTSIEHLLSVLPGNLGAMLQGQLNVEDLTPPSKPQRPNIDGSHATGLARVPFDGYIAELHKGEAVLTANENRALSQFDTAPLQNELAAIRQELAQLRIENAQLAARAESQRTTQLRTTEQLERNSRTPVRVS